jgi:8-oxo-dGTP pyrophosphatase MutT (NUDIX family)
MNAQALNPVMVLPAVGLAPGRVTGVVHRIDYPMVWTSGRRDAKDVLALPARWWPPTHGLPTGVRAVILEGLPPSRDLHVAVPVVGDVDLDLLREGETVEVDGSSGTIAIDGVEEVAVVTAFLERTDGRILLLERSSKVGSFPGRWAAVSGYLEDQPPLDQAYREVREELGIGPDDLVLRSHGATVMARDGARIYLVAPFRFELRTTTTLKLNWEAVRAEWVRPEEIPLRTTVPKLDRTWKAVAPAIAPKA